MTKLPPKPSAVLREPFTSEIVCTPLSEAESAQWVQETLRYLGYKECCHAQVDSVTLKNLEGILPELLKLRVPSPVWGIFEIEASKEEGVVRLLSSSRTLRSQALSSHLFGYPSMAAMALTLGSAFDTALKKRMLTDPAEAMIYDAAGSALIEIYADRLEREILREAGDRGLYSNFRFSPGYGDLEMSCNKLIVDLLRADKSCGITVTPGFAMQPKKSITALLGFGPTPPHEVVIPPLTGGCRPDGRCELCNLRENCKYHR